MRYEDELKSLESEWSSDEGFFWGLRQGRFMADAFDRALGKIRLISIDTDANAVVPRRVVSLLWYIPIFMQWQVERVRESAGDMGAYARATTKMVNEIERLLGVP